MKSTGEVMGLDVDFPRAFAKSQMGAGTQLPLQGTAFLSLKDSDKNGALTVANKLIALGFNLVATKGTHALLSERGINVTVINKVLEGRPHCVDAMISGGIQLVINTTEGAQSLKDSYDIRRTALTRQVCHYTTLSGAEAAVDAISALRDGALDVAPLQSYFN
jgi:carbamoyl-phosphate synthase large subunit